MTDPSIRTERLVLRPWTPAHLSEFHAIWSDPEVAWWGPTKDLDASRRLLDQIVAENASLTAGLAWYAVTGVATAEVLGNVMLRPAPYAPGEIDVGWMLARAQWGAGLATEAVGAALARAFAVGSFDRVVAVIVPGNGRSVRVARRLGFARVGTAMHAGLEHDLFAITRESLASASS
ncbi:MAG: GNAT family N-acetyltransferase [bacterium]